MRQRTTKRELCSGEFFYSWSDEHFCGLASLSRSVHEQSKRCSVFSYKIYTNGRVEKLRIATKKWVSSEAAFTCKHLNNKTTLRLYCVPLWWSTPMDNCAYLWTAATECHCHCTRCYCCKLDHDIASQSCWCCCSYWSTQFSESTVFNSVRNSPWSPVNFLFLVNLTQSFLSEHLQC